jgi:fused signal recognition particle receptor
MAGMYKKFKNGLKKTREGFVSKVNDLVAINKEIDEEFYEELEDILISSDVGVETTMRIVDNLKKEVKNKKVKKSDEVKEILKEELEKLIKNNIQINDLEKKPHVILVVGVNGVGKTTTIGKLSYKFKEKDKSIILAAGDTFRAAAIEQLEIWANRSGAGLIKHQQGSDPAAVAFDAIQAAESRGTDVVIIDTAGRLQNKVNLMNELKKINNVIKKNIPDVSCETMLVLDATNGQNALSQAKMFKESVDVSSIVLTKLDGTAKGGIIFGISSELNIPVKYIGLGEGVDDLNEFNPKDFVEALFDN